LVASKFTFYAYVINLTFYVYFWVSHIGKYVYIAKDINFSYFSDNLRKRKVQSKLIFLDQLTQNCTSSENVGSTRATFFFMLHFFKAQKD